MEKKLKIVAYKMPPQENWNAFRDSTQSNPNYITDEQYAYLADAGFTHGMGLLEHGADVAVRALETAQKHGLKYYVRDEINWADILKKDFYYLNAENYRKYMQYSSFAGVYIHDEPNASKYPALGEMVQGYYDFFQGAGEPLVNLLPTYANHIEQLGARDYEDYIRQYCEKVPTEYVMYDHYPFRVRKDGVGVFHTDYLYNASVVASLCKEYGKEMRTFVQACNVDLVTAPFTDEMLWFQIHTCLAYGSHAIVYYYYWGDELGVHDGLMDWNGNPLPIYYGAKKIHGQLRAYEDALMECVWEKTLYNKGAKVHHNEEEFSRFDCTENSLFSSQFDSIVGVFSYRGKKAYYAVNAVNPRCKVANELTFRLGGNYTVYMGGECLKTDGDGTVVLGVGGGAFFLPDEV